MEKRYIYADNSATTKVSESVLSEMLPYFTEEYGNPSSIYRLGRNAGRAVEDARARIAAVFGCQTSELYCTSGSLDPSHVLLSLGLPHEVAHGSMRLSIADPITPEDGDYIIEVVKNVVEKIRNMSPLWEDIKNKKQGTERWLSFVSPVE